MKRLIFGIFALIVLLSLVSCGDESGYRLNSRLYKTASCTIQGNEIVCPDGTRTTIPQGKDGEDGKDGVLLIEAKVDKNQCTQVYPDVYVENIESGRFFDVYSNDTCSDSLGEYCDNVETSYGSSGTYGENKKGSGDVCWAGKLMITGSKEGANINIRVLDFN